MKYSFLSKGKLHQTLPKTSKFNVMKTTVTNRATVVDDSSCSHESPNGEPRGTQFPLESLLFTIKT